MNANSSTVRRAPVVRILADAAVTVGGLFTAVSIYWGVGGTALLDTVGGSLAAQGRAGSAAVVALLWVAVALKLVATVLPVALLWTSSPVLRQMFRLLTWAEAIILTGYGLLLSVVGWLVQVGIIATSPTADQHALAWHAWLWDPWFLLWGLLVLAVLVATRRSRGPRIYPAVIDPVTIEPVTIDPGTIHPVRSHPAATAQK